MPEFTQQHDLLTRSAAALAVVGPRAVLTSHTAAALHGCTAADTTQIHVLTDDEWQTAPSTWLVTHHVAEVDEDDVLELDGLRTLALEAAVADLLRTAHPSVALECLGQAIAGLDPAFQEPFRVELEQRLGAESNALKAVRGVLGRRRSAAA